LLRKVQTAWSSTTDCLRKATVYITPLDKNRLSAVSEYHLPVSEYNCDQSKGLRWPRSEDSDSSEFFDEWEVLQAVWCQAALVDTSPCHFLIDYCCEKSRRLGVPPRTACVRPASSQPRWTGALSLQSKLPLFFGCRKMLWDVVGDAGVEDLVVVRFGNLSWQSKATTYIMFMSLEVAREIYVKNNFIFDFLMILIWLNLWFDFSRFF
jgi:hypothetical protein